MGCLLNYFGSPVLPCAFPSCTKGVTSNSHPCSVTLTGIKKKEKKLVKHRL